MELCDDGAGARVALDAVQLAVGSRLDEVEAQLQGSTKADVAGAWQHTGAAGATQQPHAEVTVGAATHCC